MLEYRASDGVPVLLGALEPKFWHRFCERIQRPDLEPLGHTGEEIEFGVEDARLRHELRTIFATATADEWQRRFVNWDVPGARSSNCRR